jgi:hypothetical protein
MPAAQDHGAMSISRVHATRLLQSLLDPRAERQELTPADCGEFAPALAPIYEAHRDHGVEAAIQVWNTAHQQYPDLAVLLAADAPELRVAPPPPLDVNELLAKKLPAVRWFVPGLLREGLAMLIGQPQIGKTPLVTQLALALAEGGRWMGTMQCEPSRVMYIATEYTEAEMQETIRTSLNGRTYKNGQLVVRTVDDDFPGDPDASLDYLEYHLVALGVNVIIIDVLTAFLPPEKFKSNKYRGDYDELKPYHRLALRHHAVILGTWHSTKRDSDPDKMHNGGNGMWAVPASRMTMYKDQHAQVRLASFPRGGEKVEWALRQKKTDQARLWVIADAQPEPDLSPLQQTVWRWLNENTDRNTAVGAKFIADMTNLNENSVKSALSRLREKGLVHTRESGKYYVEQEREEA